MPRTISLRGQAAANFVRAWKSAKKDDDKEVVVPSQGKAVDDIDDRPAVCRLLRAIKKALPRLQALLAECDGDWGTEDGIYRYYHGSFKVYKLQDKTGKIADELRALCPKKYAGSDRWLGKYKSRLDPKPPRFQRGRLDGHFEQIVVEGTGHVFNHSHNLAWGKHTRPIVEAYFHAHYFLKMMCKYGKELEQPPTSLPSGWAAVLYLYGLR